MTMPHARIDVHYHIIPHAYVKALNHRGIQGSTFVPFPDWSPEKALQQMDRTGVRTAVTSLSSPGVWFGDAGLARRLSRECNEFQALMVAQEPERFGALGFLPLPDVDGALRELEYALDDLEHYGVVLITDTDGCYLGDPEYEEIFAELDRRGAVVFIHPHDDPTQDRRYDIFSPLLEWPIHTTRAVMDLLFTGRLERYPNIRYILAHGGGTIPYLAHRIAMGPGGDRAIEAFDGRGGSDGLEETRLELLKGLFYDTASPGQAHLTALKEFVGPSRLLFGTDGGWTPPVQTAQTIKELMDFDGFGQQEMAAIEGRNARRLFPRFFQEAENQPVRAA